MPERHFQVLIVDDDADDVELARQMLRRSRVPVRIQSAVHGEDALALLRREGRHAEASRPELILLDLNMPVMNGRDFLRALKADPAIKDISVVIFTTSNVAEEIVASHGLGANGYVNKPLGLDQFKRLQEVVEDFWMRSRRLSH